MTYRRTATTPIVFVVTASRQPIRIREECEETLPEHADMLRYDLGFHSPYNLSLVIFPWFREGKLGTYPAKITEGRWGSFSMRVERFAEGVEAYDLTTDHPVGNWIGYQHSEGRPRELVPVTLNEWLKAHPKVSICGWRNATCDPAMIA